MAVTTLTRAANVSRRAKGTVTQAPIYVDSDTNTVKVIPGGHDSTTEVELLPSGSFSGNIAVTSTSSTAAIRGVNSSNGQAIEGLVNGGNGIAGNFLSSAAVGYPAVVGTSTTYYGGSFSNVTPQASEAADANAIGLVANSLQSNAGYFQQGVVGTTLTRTNVLSSLYATKVGTLGAFDMTGAVIEGEDTTASTGPLFRLRAASSVVKFLVAKSGETSITTAAGTALTLTQSATGDVNFNMVRAGGTASNWFIYLPTGSSELRFYSGADRATLSAAGTFTAAALTATAAVTGNSVASTTSVTGATMTATGAINAGAASTLGFTGRSLISSPANAQFNITNQAADAGVGLDVATDATVMVRTRAQSAYATVDALRYKTAAGFVGYDKTVYGAGTAYALTNTAAAIDLGTTDPAIVLDVAGTYLIMGQVNLQYNGATVVSETATVKVRRTNNTAADLSAVVVIDLPVSTTLTHMYGTVVIPPFVYTTSATDDAVTLFANVSAALGAGTIDATAIGTSLVAVRLY